MRRAEQLRERDYLEHIVQAITNISEYTSGANLAAYLLDKKTQDAVIRNFEVIGEACNNIVKHHAEFAKVHADIPWIVAYEMRNALAHGYFKVDHVIVWQAIQANLPEFERSILAALDTFTPT
jgi:uncharacterized protein with HEPN domain